ncbi:hypothetical protein [Pseudomonas sp. GOM6]|uniref:hypothetical protein n=1 Tax=Pseudomonas sp. GOM6 TaxID=3036944 RepID=UPI0024096314|nr:hypothetical protein [Pseudomonas sp. GOM6]MDG1582925.1 hypothetical protein [Pseudomonas sp. GOM6]
MRILLLLMAPFFAYASPPPICKDVVHNPNLIYQELPYSKGLSCIYSSLDDNEHVHISFFEIQDGKFIEVAKNSSLITISDMEISPLKLSQISSERFQLTQDYPRDTYVIELHQKKPKTSIINAYKIVKINNKDEDSTPSILSFKTKKKIIDSVDFANLYQKKIFSPNALELSSESIGIRLTITAKKAVLFSAPDIKTETKSYLIYGDTVEVVESSDKWLKIKYVTQKNILIIKWIEISSIL